MQDQDQRKYFSHATLTFVFTIASPNSRSRLIQLEVNKTQALSFCLSINRFGKPVSTLGSRQRACFSGSCSRPTKACDENLVDGLGASWLRRRQSVPTGNDAGMLFRRAVLGSARLQGSHVLLRRTGREQAVERTRQSFGGEFLRVCQPVPIRRQGGLGEIELRQPGKRL